MTTENEKVNVKISASEIASEIVSRNSLYEKLKKYESSDFYGFHMPGHKRNTELMGNGLPYGIDITEIDGFDDLHHADGVLLELEQRIAKLYGAGRSRILINGSTAGIMSAILGCVDRGSKLLVARNCHKSVYHAMELGGIEPVYLYPEFDAEWEINGVIEPEQVKAALKADPEIKAVMLVSPTYDGVVSDIRTIAEIVHSYQIPLIVDEAHGAHFGFHPYFPENSNQCGADVVIHSLHKTLPALTQTAVLHMNGRFAKEERIWHYLNMLQTSSPSYILMAGIDRCVGLLEREMDKSEMAESEKEEIGEDRGTLEICEKGQAPLEVCETSENGKAAANGEKKGKEQYGFAQYAKRLERLRTDLKESLQNLKLVEPKMRKSQRLTPETWNPGTAGLRKYDKSKILISTKRCSKTSEEIYKLLLEKYHLQMEMRAGSYILAMTSIADTEEGFERLNQALLELDGNSGSWTKGKSGKDQDTKFPDTHFPELQSNRTDDLNISFALPRAELVYPPGKAEEFRRKQQTESCPFEEAAGKISLEYAYLYPPGIPLLVPGERISGEVISQLTGYQKQGFSIEGIREQGRLEVISHG